jgi:hypothetical protein
MKNHSWQADGKAVVARKEDDAAVAGRVEVKEADGSVDRR